MDCVLRQNGLQGVLSCPPICHALLFMVCDAPCFLPPASFISCTGTQTPSWTNSVTPSITCSRTPSVTSSRSRTCTSSASRSGVSRLPIPALDPPSSCTSGDRVSNARTRILFGAGCRDMHWGCHLDVPIGWRERLAFGLFLCAQGLRAAA